MDKINTINDLFKFILYQNKTKLLIYFLIGIFVYISLSKVLPSKYMISMKFMESQMVQSESSSQGLLSSALGSVGLGSEENSLNMDKYIEMVHSHRLAEQLIKDPIIKSFFFSDEYDEVNNEWKKPDSLLNKIKLRVNSMRGKPWMEPTPFRLSEELKQEINIGLTLNSKVNSLFLYSEDIEKGKYVLNEVFKNADEIIRSIDAIQYKKYNEYLTESYDNNFVYQLLRRNEQRLMQINSGNTYIVEEVQGAFSEDYPSKPNYLSLFLLIQIFFFFIYLFHISLNYLFQAKD